MTDKIQRYLNRVGWSTITVLAETFSLSRRAVALALNEILTNQDVRVYNDEIVHV